MTGASAATTGPYEHDAIVLAGGASRRFGTDKLAATVDGTTLLDRALDATAAARRVVAVGSVRPTRRPVTWTRENPPGSGPAAAVVAGLTVCEAPYVVLLAGDLPWVSAATVRRLLSAATAATADAATAARAASYDGALLVDADGRAQLLCSAWRRTALLAAASRRTDWRDASLRSLLEPLSRTEVPAVGREASDVDRPEDLPSEA